MDDTNDKFIKTFNDPKVKNTIYRLLRDFQKKNFYILTWPELEQLGHIAVWKALNNYKPGYNRPFSSFAFQKLKWMLADEYRKYHPTHFVAQSALQSIPEKQDVDYLELKEALCNLSKARVRKDSIKSQL